MKKIFFLVLFFSFAVVPLSCRAASNTNQLRAKIDQYMHATEKVYHFMGSILVAQNGKIILAKGYGMANLKKHLPNTAETNSGLGR